MPRQQTAVFGAAVAPGIDKLHVVGTVASTGRLVAHLTNTNAAAPTALGGSVAAPPKSTTDVQLRSLSTTKGDCA